MSETPSETLEQPVTSEGKLDENEQTCKVETPYTTEVKESAEEKSNNETKAIPTTPPKKENPSQVL